MLCASVKRTSRAPFVHQRFGFIVSFPHTSLLPRPSACVAQLDMGKIDPAILEEFDLLAGAIGITPKFNSDNEIVPIGARNPRGKVYVVWVGRGVGLFSNWCV